MGKLSYRPESSNGVTGTESMFGFEGGNVTNNGYVSKLINNVIEADRMARDDAKGVNEKIGYVSKLIDQVTEAHRMVLKDAIGARHHFPDRPLARDSTRKSSPLARRTYTMVPQRPVKGNSSKNVSPNPRRIICASQSPTPSLTLPTGSPVVRTPSTVVGDSPFPRSSSDQTPRCGHVSPRTPKIRYIVPQEDPDMPHPVPCRRPVSCLLEGGSIFNSPVSPIRGQGPTVSSTSSSCFKPARPHPQNHKKDKLIPNEIEVDIIGL